MCATPGCRANLPEFNLIGPLGEPPKGGWKIQKLPESAAGLQDAWSALPNRADNAKAAWLAMMQFLAHNGLTSPELSQEIVNLGIRQWCTADPNRCERKYRKEFTAKIEQRFFPWAKAAWEELNNTLHDDLAEEDVGPALAGQISKLSALINPTNPATGCAHCHTHWQQVLADNPIPNPLTLDAARHWVVNVHNLTREGREPVPYSEIATKFHWSDPAPVTEPDSE